MHKKTGHCWSFYTFVHIEGCNVYLFYKTIQKMLLTGNYVVCKIFLLVDNHEKQSQEILDYLGIVE